jgi:hypothetical protein
MTRTRVAVLATATFLGGVGIGGYAVVNFMSEMMSSFGATSAVAGVSTHVAILQSLRDGNVSGAIDLLETLLDGDLMSVGAYRSDSLPQASTKPVRRAAEYRAKYPRKTENPEVDAAVSRGLRVFESGGT